MNDVLDSLGSLKEQRQEEYRLLIDRFLAGEKIPASEIEMACVLAGKEPGDFARTVRTRQQRAKERERHATLPDVKAKLAGIDAEIAANNAKLEAAQQAHTEEAWRLAPLRQELLEELAQVGGIEQQLVKSCGDEALADRAASLQLYLEDNRRKSHDAQRHLHTQQAVLRQGADSSLERWWYDRNATSPPLPKEVPDNAPFAALKRRVLRAAAVVDELDEQAAAYRAELEENRRQQYEW